MVRKQKDAILDQGPTSLFLFTPSSPLRRLATWFTKHPLFEGTITITILVNCIVMALDDKLPVEDKTILSLEMVSILVIYCIDVK
jgi:hypothetical protein